LPTFIFPTPKLSKIHVILRKGNKYIYDISSKCKEIWATQFPWAKMMKNDTKASFLCASQQISKTKFALLNWCDVPCSDYLVSGE
jgi:hypothetical protein